MNDKIQAPHFFKTLTAIHYVESQLEKPISKKAFGRLFAQLETVQKNCADEELTFRIVSLYGKIVDRYLASEVAAISNLAKKSTANATLALKRIDDLKKFGLSQNYFAVISNIEKMLRTGKSPVFTAVNKTMDRVYIEEVEDLFGLAGFIYYNEKEKIEKAKKGLSNYAEKVLQKHLILLKTTFLQDPFSTVQALFATAYELSGANLSQYSSKKEIDVFFTELRCCSQGDSASLKTHKVLFLRQA